MANLCDFQMKITGKKDNVNIMLKTIPWNEVVFEKGTNDSFTTIITGECKWDLDYNTINYYNEKLKKDLSNYIDKTGVKDNTFIEKYGSYSLKSKSKIFDVDIEVFCEYEDYDSSSSEFFHYKDGKRVEKKTIPISKITKSIKEKFKINNLVPDYYLENIDDDSYLIDELNDDDYSRKKSLLLKALKPYSDGEIVEYVDLSFGDSIEITHQIAEFENDISEFNRNVLVEQLLNELMDNNDALMNFDSNSENFKETLQKEIDNIFCL